MGKEISQSESDTGYGGERAVKVLYDALEDYQRLLEALEELDSIKAYDEAKASEDEVIPFEQAVEEIERGLK